jgi:pimeloyl-ACP methyl ester carboxylesterase
MPYATNPADHVRTYFEDSGGGGEPVLVYPGFTDPLGYAKASPLAQALEEEFRLIFADHRGQGRSDKPHDIASYALTSRVADAVAILDALGIERAHYIGFSWGARLGFAIGEHAPRRVLSLVLCGNQPYAWPVDGPMLRAVSGAVAAGREHGMVAFVETWEAAIGERFPEPGRSWVLENDPLALDAEFRSLSVEGPISQDLTSGTSRASSTQARTTSCMRTPPVRQRRSRAPRSSRSQATLISQPSACRISSFRESWSCSAQL